MKKAPKKNPIPVRLDPLEDSRLSEIAAQTGLSKSEVVRRACRFAMPKFLSGEVDVARVIPEVLA